MGLLRFEVVVKTLLAALLGRLFLDVFQEGIHPGWRLFALFGHTGDAQRQSALPVLNMTEPAPRNARAPIQPKTK